VGSAGLVRVVLSGFGSPDRSDGEGVFSSATRSL
jgi:hypothetical protein